MLDVELALELSLSEPFSEFGTCFLKAWGVVRDDETADGCGLSDQGKIVLDTVWVGRVYGKGNCKMRDFKKGGRYSL